MAAEDGAIPARAANLAGLVLANLLANAIEAAPRHGRVRLEAKRVEGGVEFLVTDSGPGLPPEVREALFRPVRSTKRGGGGVGLAISHRLARHAGGELALVSSDARGAVFRLFVPAAGARVNGA
jgi:signal transduction histidine kinase